MTLIEQFIPKTATGRRPQIPMSPTYITVHGTANSNSTAKNEADNVCNNYPLKEASFHIVVDDKEAYQTLPFNEVAWHAGDGMNGTGNRKSIAIEICESGDRYKALMNAVEIIIYLMKRFNIPLTNVRQHYHWSGKDCPRILKNTAYIKDSMDWGWFIAQLKKQIEPDYKALYENELKKNTEILKQINEIGKICDIIKNIK